MNKEIKPSNPVVGIKWDRYCYEPREKDAVLMPYYFRVDMLVKSNTAVPSILFFAQSDQHARGVLFEMVMYYISEHANNQYCQHTVMKFKEIKQAMINNPKWTPPPAPTNQFYKVGWADNDVF